MLGSVASRKELDSPVDNNARVAAQTCPPVDTENPISVAFCAHQSSAGDGQGIGYRYSARSQHACAARLTRPDLRGPTCAARPARPDLINKALFKVSQAIIGVVALIQR